jgi:hypothetical protein
MKRHTGLDFSTLIFFSSEKTWFPPISGRFLLTTPSPIMINCQDMDSYLSGLPGHFKNAGVWKNNHLFA